MKEWFTQSIDHTASCKI